MTSIYLPAVQIHRELFLFPKSLTFPFICAIITACDRTNILWVDGISACSTIIHHHIAHRYHPTSLYSPSVTPSTEHNHTVDCPCESKDNVKSSCIPTLRTICWQHPTAHCCIGLRGYNTMISINRPVLIPNKLWGLYGSVDLWKPHE